MPRRSAAQHGKAAAKPKAKAGAQPHMCLAEVNPDWLLQLHALCVELCSCEMDLLCGLRLMKCMYQWGNVHTEEFWANDLVSLDLASISWPCWVLHPVSHCQHWYEVVQKCFRSCFVILDMLHLAYHIAQDGRWVQGLAGRMLWTSAHGVFSSVFDFWLT